MVTILHTTLALLLLLGSGPTGGLVTGEESEPTAGQPQQITTITTSSSEPCTFNRFCTCVTENVQSITPHSDGVQLDSNLEQGGNSSNDDLLNALHIEQAANTVYSHSKLYEITCLNSPFYSVPKLPGSYLYRLNLIGSKQLSRIKASSFSQSQISSITISRSKVQVLLRINFYLEFASIGKFPKKQIRQLALSFHLGHRQ